MRGEGGGEVDGGGGEVCVQITVVGGSVKGFGGGIVVEGGGALVEGVVVCEEGGGGGGERAGLTVVIRRVGDGRRLSREWLLDLCKTEIQIVSSKFARHFWCAYEFKMANVRSSLYIYVLRERKEMMIKGG